MQCFNYRSALRFLFGAVTASLATAHWLAGSGPALFISSDALDYVGEYHPVTGVALGMAFRIPEPGTLSLLLPAGLLLLRRRARCRFTGI